MSASAQHFRICQTAVSAIVAVGAATLLTTSLCLPSDASVSSTGGDSSSATSSQLLNTTCAGTYSGKGGTGSIPSGDYTPPASEAIYTNQAAQPFTVSTPCQATSINVVGRYANGNGVGVPKTVNVYFYNAAWNLQTGMLTPSGSPFATRAVPLGPGLIDSNGSLSLNWTQTASPQQPVNLAPNSMGYFVSVQVKMNLSGGSWEWYTVRAGAGGPIALWENPGHGFPNCPTWSDAGWCFSYTFPLLMDFTLGY